MVVVAVKGVRRREEPWITFSKVCPYEPLFICILDCFILPWRPFISEGRGWRKNSVVLKSITYIKLYTCTDTGSSTTGSSRSCPVQWTTTWSCWILFCMSVFLISKNPKKLPSENKVSFSFLLLIPKRRLWRLEILGFGVAPLQSSKHTHTEGERENYESRQAW